LELVNDNEALLNGKKVAINKPVQTDFGLILITRLANTGRTKAAINVSFSPIENVIQRYKNQIQINPASKQATVLVITLEDAIPQRGKDILDRLVEEYNQAAIDDKNKVTASTLAFLEERLLVIESD